MIVRVQKTENYISINNEPLRDSTLSWAARGVLAFLLSQPDNWEANTDHLVSQGQGGRDQMLRVLKELEQHGYLLREKLRDTSGRWEWTNTIFETPQQGKPESGNPSTAKPTIKEVPIKQEVPIKTSLPSKAEPVASRAEEVFTHWQKILNHPQAKLDSRRKRAIQGRLRDYTLEDLKRAVDGCRASPFHMGENSDGKIYDDITLICRDSTHVEMFMAVLTAPKKPKKDPSVVRMEDALGITWQPRTISTPEEYAAMSGRPVEEVRAKWH